MGVFDDEDAMRSEPGHSLSGIEGEDATAKPAPGAAAAAAGAPGRAVTGTPTREPRARPERLRDGPAGAEGRAVRRVDSLREYGPAASSAATRAQDLRPWSRRPRNTRTSTTRNSQVRGPRDRATVASFTANRVSKPV